MDLSREEPAGAQESHTKESGVTWLALFTTLGTLICCALPIMLVTLGLGAAVVSLTSSFPILITLSQHKAWVFATSGGLLLLSGWLLYRPGRHCPTDPKLGELCSRSQRWNRRIYWVSVTIWALGFTAAYLALPIRIWLGL
ncbi:MAG TPA: hypothetical protein ENJ98_02870 [Thiolapillus brandeum]|uniref:Mercuric transport protein MerT n=1 Tax=Thiolapillus brandeum TaxID=1076588 RepID=A0A7C5IZ77_9GAMM|nr:hypothetical protein [Thiolapillus brandeum]